jgi:hypothetical protein
MDKIPSIEPILKIGLGFWASKALLSAVELGIFTELAEGPLAAEKLASRTNLHSRSALDFFDALVAMGLLERHDGLYVNTPATDYYLDRNKSTYAGGFLEMANGRLYRFWGSLTNALQTGVPQNEATNGENFFEKLYSSPDRLDLFLSGMTGLSLVTARAIANQFPWDDYRTFADVGCAQGALPVQIALHHAHVRGIGFDLPLVQPIFENYVRSHTLEDRLTFQGGDFFKGDLPRVDVLVMGHILHDWDLKEKKKLLRKAYDALPPGGALIVHEALIDDERRANAPGLLMSLNMLIETPGGFDFTGADCQGWMREAGFRETRVEPLAWPDSMVVAIK